MALKRSRRVLQLWFRPRRDPTPQLGVMAVQSFGSPGNLCHLDVGVAERRRVYYREYGGGILPSPGRGESCDLKCPWLVPTPKGVPERELTNWVVCFDANSSLIN
jgi:hypothetical protein